MLPADITNDSWIKNWSSKWRTSFASLYWMYTTSLESYGQNLRINLVVCDKDSSSNYIAKKELDKYAGDLATRIISDYDFGQKLALETDRTARSLHEFFAVFDDEKNLTLENLLELKKRFYVHIAPHVAMKKVIDYLPEGLRNELSAQFTEARITTEKLDLFNVTDEILKKFINKISKKSGYGQNIVEFLTIEEIAAYLERGVLPNEQELVERSKGLGIYFEGNSFKLLVGEDYQALMRHLVGESKTELKGNAAYLGVAKGVVRIVIDPTNVKEFNEGDILVTGMTRPEFLPLMKKAAAFVTDAGGLLSHAAIVARELQKPCLLATEIGTKVLHDGDEVEVDATKGVVKIIKRAS